MKRVQESIILSIDKITPLPNMPESMIGIMNSRDRVFCVFDLPQLLGLPSSLASPREYQLIVVEDLVSNSQESKTLFIGFAVPRVLGITRLESEAFHMPQEISERLKSFILGSPKDVDPSLVVLDETAIFKAASVDHSPR